MKTILSDRAGYFIRTAMVEDGRLVDLVVDRKHSCSITGNIYLGLVKNVLPNQFAFVDIGQPKNGFLNGADSGVNNRFRQGQVVLVQVRKDPTGEKGASLNTRLDMTGRLVILYASKEGEIGVSHKIKSASERERLKQIIKKNKPNGFAVIARTNAEYKSADEILSDMEKQVNRYRQIRIDSAVQNPPALIYQDNNPLCELLRDGVDEIIVNVEDQLAAIRADVEMCMPGEGSRVKLHKADTSLFNAEIERQIDRALEKKIWLDSGAFLIIEQTEACVIIDVNTGKFTGEKNYRDSILKTNMEAAKEIAAQIRLRNLSGMIIIDFINMDSEVDKVKLYQFFSGEIAKDRIKTNIIGMTELGLMQLTRRKTRESLGHIMLEECRHCHGNGRIRI